MNEKNSILYPEEEALEKEELSAKLGVVREMMNLGMDYGRIYVFAKTDLILTTDKEKERPEKDLQAFHAAISEYIEILKRKNNNRK